MQVTRDNFPAVFPKFVELLQTCDFYAIDEEMTGINVADKPESITDTPEETYRAKREAASRYSIIQVGICLFHKDDDTNCGSAKKASYTARPFNFILFPTHVEGMTNTGLSQDVVLSASSLAFLRRHGMDFQSWVYRGLAYCNAAGETVLRQVWKERLDAEAGNGCGEQCQNSAGMDLLTEEERTWFSNAVAITQGFSERVQIALERAAAKHAGQGVGSVELSASLELMESSGREVFLAPQRSKNARECLEKHVKQHFNNVTLTFRRSGSAYHGTLRAVFPEERARQMERESALRERELMDMLGFRLVFKAMVGSKKPCVGHNCLADILFVLNSFDGPLPEALTDFKQKMSELFPVLFDTRYIATRQDFFPRGRFSQHYLGGYFEEYGFSSAHVRITLPIGFEAYDPLTLESRGRGASGGSGSLAHEAGFDALLTGTLLLNLLAEIGCRDIHTAPPGLRNRVALFRSLFALSLSPAGEDEYLPVNGVLDLRHEKHIKIHHMDNCFSTLSLQGVALHTVDEGRTLAVLPHEWPKSCGTESPDVERLSIQLTTRFPQYFQASPYIPPTPIATRGLLRVTAPTLSRALLRALML